MVVRHQHNHLPAPANDGSDDKIVLFGTVEDLYTILQWLNHLLLMEHCPLIFYQVFSIHIMKHGQTFPMVYAVLPNKQRQTYLRRRMRQKERQIFPCTILQKWYVLVFKCQLSILFPEGKCVIKRQL